MGRRSIEVLTHFQCGKCRKWWSIGDCDPERREWFCPWCGLRQVFREDATPRPKPR